MSQMNPAFKSHGTSPAAAVAADATAKTAPNSPKPLPPYESDLVCDFFRQIGRLEVARRYETEVREAGLSLFNQAKTRVAGAVDKLELLLSSSGIDEAKPGVRLVGNAQNPLDHLVGDVLGRSEAGRYFIIEFKRESAGFVEEVDLRRGKLDRAALLDQLRLGRVNTIVEAVVNRQT